MSFRPLVRVMSLSLCLSTHWNQSSLKALQEQHKSSQIELQCKTCIDIASGLELRRLEYLSHWTQTQQDCQKLHIKGRHCDCLWQQLTKLHDSDTSQWQQNSDTLWCVTLQVTNHQQHSTQLTHTHTPTPTPPALSSTPPTVSTQLTPQPLVTLTHLYTP